MKNDFFHRLKQILLPNYFHALRQNLEHVVARVDEISDSNRNQTHRMEELQQEIDQKLELQQEIDQKLEQQQKQMLREIESLRNQLMAVDKRLDETFWTTANTEGKLESLRAMWVAETMSKYEDISSSKLFRSIRGLRELMHTKRPVDKQLIRTGRGEDGGYIMLDDFESCKVAYSFGIADDVSWDKYMAERGIDVYMYDHTIEGLPEENQHFHWQKTGVAGVYDSAVPELRTLPQLMEDNGHTGRSGMILKMDVEGAEWEVFRNLPAGFLNCFDQILLELHDMNSLEKYQDIAASLKTLNETHQLVHVHGNNCAHYLMCNGLVVPGAMECTYISKEKYSFKEDETFYPDELDASNDRRWPDIMLGRWG
ncbi:FkbM family methyltransferase [Selenomonas sp. AB3002]|uniref:FkbM family methyltransferase n=1 Tax=Selenomonas sp. AB3002 TaxID=1392502 RepID=UPI000563BF27